MELMENLVQQKKGLVLILAKETQSVAWVYIIILTIVIFLIMENKYFFTQLRLGSISNGICATESREISLNRYRYDFSVDSNSIDKSNILDIHKNLMTKNKIK